MGLKFTLDGFRCVYGCIVLFMWGMTLIFGRQYFKHYTNLVRYGVFNILTLFATLGVFLSADFFTTFVFFEIMSFTSFVWVAHDETPEALRAACTYLSVAIIGGLITLMGIFMLYNAIGTLDYNEIPGRIEEIRRSWLLYGPGAGSGLITKGKLYLIGGLLVTGFIAKAGVWPLHIWLPKAHPVAPAPASALLSGILTKSGIFGILAITCNMFLPDTWWGRVMLWLGVITMFTGALLGVFGTNIKRILACSSMSQIGFIMVGIGMYSILGESRIVAAEGIVLHMVNHSMIKLLLFMAAGAIYINTHALDLNSIRGYGKNKHFLKTCFAIGALSISGIPGFSGYISKTLLHESISLKTAEIIFLVSGGMTLCYMLKIFIAVFVDENNDPSLQAKYDSDKGYLTPLSRIAIGAPAIVLFVMGILPHQTMDKIARLSAGFLRADAEVMAEETVKYFSGENLLGALISISIGLVLYFFVANPFLSAMGEKGRTYLDRWPKGLDLEDRVYRPFILKIAPGFLGFFCAIASQIADEFFILLRRTLFRQVSTKVPTGSLDDRMAIVTGEILDKVLPDKNNKSHIPDLVRAEEGLARTQRMISGSLSFGLILVCLGLILVLIYTLATS